MFCSTFKVDQEILNRSERMRGDINQRVADATQQNIAQQQRSFQAWQQANATRQAAFDAYNAYNGGKDCSFHIFRVYSRKRCI